MKYIKLRSGSRSITGLPVLLVLFALSPGMLKGQSKKSKGAGTYRNLFREAGYSQAAIDKKIGTAYYDIFEGPKQGIL